MWSMSSRAGMLRSVKASPTMVGAFGVRRETPCSAWLRRPRLNNCVESVALEQAASRRRVSSLSGMVFFQGKELGPNLGDAARAAELHRAHELVAEDRQGAPGPLLAARAHAVERRAADHYGLRAPGQRLEDVRPAPDAAVHEHRGPAADRARHRGQRIERGQLAVQLAPAVV